LHRVLSQPNWAVPIARAVFGGANFDAIRDSIFDKNQQVGPLFGDVGGFLKEKEKVE
jgi:hypothetical protein